MHLDRIGDGVRIPVEEKIIFISPKLSEWMWGPSSPARNRYHTFTGAIAAGA